MKLGGGLLPGVLVFGKVWWRDEPVDEAQCGRRAHFTSQQASSSPLQVGVWRGPGGPFPVQVGFAVGAVGMARVPEIEILFERQKQKNGTGSD